MAIATASGANSSRSLSLVKNYFKKPMTLVVAILSLLTLITEFMFSAAANDLVADFAAAAGQTDVSTSGNPIGYLVSGIVTLCLFMIFVFSISPSGGPTIWFTILHVFSVLELILTSLISLVIVVFEIVFIFATPTLVNFFAGLGENALSEMSEDQLEAINRSAASFRITLLVFLAISLVIIGVTLYYINAQTAFLKSITQTCKNPMLKSKGAVPYGNVSLVLGVIQLIGVVIMFLSAGSTDAASLEEMGISIPTDFSSITTPYIIYSLCAALYIVFRGYFAKGWEKYTQENKDFVFESVGASARYSDASPMPTYKSTTRASSDARQQSQPYLIGEEEDKNKKSSYIPEELQTDYSPEPQPMDPYGSPFGNQPPYGNQPPFGGNTQFGGQPPFGGDPFAMPPQQQPPMGNPYGGGQYGNPGGGYNNGMF